MTQTVVYIIRHAQSNSNNSELPGKKNTSLTVDGVGQAKRLAHFFRVTIKDPTYINNIYTSNFRRAQETAEALSKVKKSYLELRERSFGSLEDTPGQKLLMRFKNYLDELPKEERRDLAFVRDMETDETAFKRFHRCLSRIADQGNNQTSLIFTHSNIMRIFLVYIGWATFEELPSGSIMNTAFAKLRWDGSKFQVLETQGIIKTLSNLRTDR